MTINREESAQRICLLKFCRFPRVPTLFYWKIISNGTKFPPQTHNSFISVPANALATLPFFCSRQQAAAAAEGFSNLNLSLLLPLLQLVESSSDGVSEKSN